ncbi:MAG TPA: hypothetical protein VFN41_04930 [Candidatus Limnocylindrales bacterium]|nr:hypothetical protein [Candidatus Limnocylindrales bacterium]
MACSCDSCSSPRIIKTRTALYWRWVAQSRGETADRVIPAPARTVVAVGNALPEAQIPAETAEVSLEASKDEAVAHDLAERRAEFLRIVGGAGPN